VNERRWWLTNDRWGVAAVIALVGAAVAAAGRAWAEAAVFFIAAVALAIVTVRSRAR
jgi:hypothetical protein